MVFCACSGRRKQTVNSAPADLHYPPARSLENKETIRAHASYFHNQYAFEPFEARQTRSSLASSIQKSNSKIVRQRSDAEEHEDLFLACGALDGCVLEELHDLYFFLGRTYAVAFYPIQANLR